MHIELSEYLRCPERHADDPFCVLMPDEMVGRDVRRGTVACPACHREYRIENGIVEFGGDTGSTIPFADFLPSPDAVHALLGLTGPGGHVVLVGSAAHLVRGLPTRLAGVHFVGVNAASDVTTSAAASLVRHPSQIPLRTRMARGVVIGRECCRPPWLDEGARVLLRGQRLVAFSDAARADGLEGLAVGEGMWVGQRR